MPEFIVIFLSLVIIPSIFWYFDLPVQLLSWLMLGFAFVIALPMLYTLFSAPFVPSKKQRVDTMLGLAKLKKEDSVCELGCGDGRVIRAAANAGVKKAVGYEISIPLIVYGKLYSFFTKNSAKITWGNIWKQDYSDISVIFCYLAPFAMKRLAKEIWPNLKSGTRIISNGFKLPGVEEELKEKGVYLYIKK